MKTVKQMFGLSTTKGEVGIEIEMEGARLRNIPGRGEDSWFSTEDGSLRGEALEYVLKKPVDRDKTREVLGELSELFKDHLSFLNPSDRCGVHVHINCQDLTFDQVMNFVCIYLILEDVLTKYCGEDREGNLFCLRACDAEELVDALCVAMRLHSFRFIINDRFRYAAINLSSLAKYGSLEFRALQTPTNIMEVETWVNMILKIKDYALRYNNIKEVLASISMQGPEIFLRSVLQEYSPAVACDDIDGKVFGGLRRAQDIAYTERKVEKKKTEKELQRGRRAAVQHVEHLLQMAEEDAIRDMMNQE